MISQINHIYPVPSFQIDRNLNIRSASQEAWDMFERTDSLMRMIDSKSCLKAKQMLQPSNGKVSFEINMIDKKGQILLVDCYAGWTSELHGEIMILEKNKEMSNILSQFQKLRTRLQETDMELLKEKERLQQVLMENNMLSAPFIKINDDIGLIPVFGIIDQQKITAIMDNVLKSAYEAPTRELIIDFTAVNHMDREGWRGFTEMFQSLKLLGKHIYMTGVQPKHAHQIHEFNIQTDIIFKPSLQDIISKFVK
ncbi:STAS domain-containing protein [Oceanobacillus piezotolerans]|uniref:STAS domain-containing protein n=1 Tax=Oceanobacillus piezotolerans TaxID=2448030 RepID=A0A498D3T3_9BACI|nr:STAS domain-containing protein [Oceanobacillus piezotolerans]RLL42130.1 STAS domain-containing protein [Oceanobacillus piezotolerans]